MQRAESIRHLVVAMGAFDGVHLGHQALIHLSLIHIYLRANLEQSVSLAPLERRLIPTGLFMEIPAGYEGQVLSLIPI